MKVRLIFLCFLPLYISAQDIGVQLEKAISILRDHALSQPGASLDDVKSILNKWHELDNDEDRIYQFALDVHYAINVGNYGLKKSKNRVSKDLKKSTLSSSINDEVYAIIKNNDDLFGLYVYGYLNTEYPFEPKVDSFTVKEYEFLDIHLEEDIADIGSGSGQHAFLLAAMYPENDIYLNEINPELLEYLNRKSKRHKDLWANQNRVFEIIKGKISKAQIPVPVDKVIVRNTFHHFEKKNAMINSILKKIKLDGELVLIEPLKTEDSKEGLGCGKKLEKEKLLKKLKQYNFEKVAEIEKTAFIRINKN